MRFIHIADVHLGMQPDAGFPWSEERGEAIWESFRRIIRLAGREKTDFLLIAGDLFQCRYRHAVNISRTDRYRVFNMGEIRTFSVKLTGLEPGKYCLRLYKVTKEHGSSYDAWVRMGAPERMNRMERAMLCHSADPEYRVWEQETDPEGSLTVQERLEPHETALIEVEQIL